METKGHKTKKQTAHAILVRTCVSGVMVALAVVFCRLLGFPQEGMWRVEISFLPIAFIAILWGPLWAGAAYGAADLIGAAMTTGINPFITIEKVLTGVVMGIFFRRRRGGKRENGWLRIVLAFAVVSVALDFCMMTLIFRFAFGYTWGAALIFRGANAAVNFAIRCILMLICDKTLTPRLVREGEKYGA